MTRVLRETDRYQLIMEVFNQYTSILERNTGKMSNWNTGQEALDEAKELIVIEEDEFNTYCDGVEKD
jgi:hypothetical protein